MAEFIKQMMPWAHVHHIKAITRFVLAIIDKQAGCQAETVRHQVRFQVDLSKSQWGKLNAVRFEGNTRRLSLEQLYYCQGSLRWLCTTTSRARNKKGKLEA